MEFVLKPFIAVYHSVKKVLSLPNNLKNKANNTNKQAVVNNGQINNQPVQQMPGQLNNQQVMNQPMAQQPVAGQPMAQQPVAQSPMPNPQVMQQPAQPVGTPTGQAPMPQGKNVTSATQAAKEINAPVVDSKGRVKRPTKSYKYTIINGVGKKENGTFDAETADEVRAFLTSQQYQVLSVAERSKYDIDLNFNKKIKVGDLSFALTQLSTYIRSGIPLVDSVRILAKQTQKPALKKSYQQLVYELLKGENFSDALESQGDTYPKLLINMVKTAEMTGDLPTILDDMAEYYNSMEITKKQMKSALTYPVVVLIIAFGVLIFMLTYLVPQFSSMFEENDATLPALTLIILGVSDFIKKNYIIMIVAVAGIIGVFVYLYKNVLSFRTAVQTFEMHIPVFKNIIIYNEIANFTKTFSSLLNHGVFITDSMDILSKITNNEIYKRIISKCLVNLGKGDSISSAFKGEWAIPVVAYEMIVTGETTGQLGLMMEKVSEHFQALHKSIIDQMKSLIEPILICFLAVVVGIILMSIVQPMFSIYSQVK